MERRPSTVRMGPISVFALVIILCLAVLGVLSVTSASAGSALAQRQAEFAVDDYRNEIVGQSFYAHADDVLAQVRAQGGDVVQGPEAGRLTSEQIVRMRWLNENVVGRLPEQRELDRDGLVEVEAAGVIPVDPSTVLLKDTSR